MAEENTDAELVDLPEEIIPEPPERVSREQFLANIDTANDDPLEDMRWVYQALGAEDLKPEDAPSPGAWAMLTNLQSDDLALKAFYTNTYTKLLPPKSQMEQGDEHADDDREIFGLIERLLSEPLDAAPVLTDTERRARELALQKKSN